LQLNLLGSNQPCIFMLTNKNFPSLKVVILSRNRIEYLKEAVSSILDSIALIPKDVNCCFEVSDNSETEDCVALIRTFFPEVQVKLRRPCLSSYDHFFTVMSEAETDFLVVFHDDDKMKVEFLPDLYDLLNQNQNVSAVASNANTICDGKETIQTFINNIDNFHYVDSKGLIDAYFLIGKQGIAPFPSYMYRVCFLKKALKKLKPTGKYGDVALLLILNQIKPFIWTKKILMSYRIHDSSDSAQKSIYDLLKLFHFLRKKFAGKSLDSINDLRLVIFIFWFKNRNLKLMDFFKWTKKQKTVFRFISFEIFKRFIFRPGCVKVFVKKYRGIR